jgi:hypothetical protein
VRYRERMQEDGAATVVIAAHGTRGVAEKASVQFGPNHERYAFVAPIQSGTSKTVVLNIAGSLRIVSGRALFAAQTTGTSASPSRTTTAPTNYGVECLLPQRGMSALRNIDGLQRVESANSISETAAVRSAFLYLGSPIFKRPLCRFLHCGCDNEQRLLCLDSGHSRPESFRAGMAGVGR